MLHKKFDAELCPDRRFMVGNDLTKPEYDRFSLRVVKHFLGKRQFIRRHRTSIA